MMRGVNMGRMLRRLGMRMVVMDTWVPMLGGMNDRLTPEHCLVGKEREKTDRGRVYVLGWLAVRVG